MRTRNIAFLAAVAVGATLPLRAVDGTVLATSGASIVIYRPGHANPRRTLRGTGNSPDSARVEDGRQ